MKSTWNIYLVKPAHFFVHRHPNHVNNQSHMRFTMLS